MWVEVEVTTTKTHLVEVDMKITNVTDVTIAKQKAYDIIDNTLGSECDKMKAAIAVYEDVVSYADEVHKL